MLIVAIGLLIFYYIKIYRMIKTYEISPVKLSAKEAYQKALRNYGKGFLIFGLIVGIFLFIIGILSSFLISDGLNPLAPIILTTIGLVLSLCYVRMLIYNKRQ